MLRLITCAVLCCVIGLITQSAHAAEPLAVIETTFERAQQILVDDPVTAVVLPIFFAAVAVEAIWSKVTDRGLYHARDASVSFLMLLASVLIEVIPKFLIVAAMVATAQAA